MGRKAINKFMDYGIEVITAAGLNCTQALNRFIAGELHGYSPCEHEHHHGNCHHH
jgi:predicted Fe-Mo cluster-binding NifX family protein